MIDEETLRSYAERARVPSVAECETMARELLRLRSAPNAQPGWRYQALAYLGYIRDKMPPEHVVVVQDFLGVPPTVAPQPEQGERST